MTLDHWTEQLGINLDEVTFVKMDVQGSEIAVLDGAARLLARRHIAWQIEIDLELLGERGYQASDLFERLRRHFTHFIDLGSRAMGQRVLRSTRMEEALTYVSGGTEGRTDVLVFNLDETVGN